MEGNEYTVHSSVQHFGPDQNISKTSFTVNGFVQFVGEGHQIHFSYRGPHTAHFDPKWARPMKLPFLSDI